jgi:hypothetical protein
VADADLGTAIIAAAAGVIGAGMGGLASIRAARQQARASMQVAKAQNKEDQQTWLRNSRRDVYAHFLPAAQKLLRLCEQLIDAAKQGSSSVVSMSEQEEAYYELVVQNALVQILANGEVIKAAHDVMEETRHLWEECRNLAPYSSEVDRLDNWTYKIRDLRHKAICTMQDELGIPQSGGLKETLDNLSGSQP